MIPTAERTFINKQRDSATLHTLGRRSLGIADIVVSTLARTLAVDILSARISCVELESSLRSLQVVSDLKVPEIAALAENHPGDRVGAPRVRMLDAAQLLVHQAVAVVPQIRAFRLLAHDYLLLLYRYTSYSNLRKQIFTQKRPRRFRRGPFARLPEPDQRDAAFTHE